MSEARKKIVCFGPGPMFKGGIQNFNTSLALAFERISWVDVEIVSWTQQYPGIIPRQFRDLQSKVDLLKDSKVPVTYLTNYNNPLSWRNTVQYILSRRPDVVVFQWSIALQGLPMGAMARSLRKAGIHVVFDVHFVIQKEHSFIDRILTRRALKQANSFVVHASQTYRELQELFPNKPWQVVSKLDSAENDKVQVVQLFHPVYDLYRPIEGLDIEAEKQKLGLNKHVFLFFGFIRKYKGLDMAIEAFAQVCKQRSDVSFLICGESFWHTLDNKKWSTRVKQFLFGLAKKVVLQKSDDEREYAPLERIKELGIEKQCVVFNRFIGNEELPVFFQVSDAAVLFYRTATPSGIESLSYNFKLPILATRVGHFPETIEDGFNGYLADAENTEDMARIMLRFLDNPIDRNNVVKATENMSWDNFAGAIAGNQNR
jgi:glycosyltransferase involved in cell wall biosynthesis